MVVTAQFAFDDNVRHVASRKIESSVTGASRNTWLDVDFGIEDDWKTAA